MATALELHHCLIVFSGWAFVQALLLMTGALISTRVLSSTAPAKRPPLAAWVTGVPAVCLQCWGMWALMLVCPSFCLSTDHFPPDRLQIRSVLQLRHSSFVLDESIGIMYC